MSARPIIVSREERESVRVVASGPPGANGASAGPAISAGVNGPRCVLFETTVPVAAGTLFLPDLALTTWDGWTPPLVDEDFGTLTLPDPVDRFEWRPSLPGIYEAHYFVTAATADSVAGVTTLVVAPPMPIVPFAILSPVTERFSPPDDGAGIDYGRSATSFVSQAMVDNGFGGFYFATPSLQLDGAETGDVTVSVLIVDYTNDADAPIWSEL